MRPLRSLISLSLLCLFVLSACAPSSVEVVSEADEKQYHRAKRYKDQGRTSDALTAFLGVIDARRDAPESHLEAGNIYLREMKDPVRAIYHFNRYLEFKPQSDQAPQVRQLIETAEKEFARQLPAQPYSGELDRLDLLEMVKNLRKEHETMKRELAESQKRVRQLESMLGDARRAPPAQTTNITPLPQTRPTPTTTVTASASPAPPASPAPESVPRSYTVQSGDSLSTISRKFYGTPSRWIDIYQANRDRLSSENALRVGQELRIP
ncbi:MAG: Cell division protein CpoB [Coraliomargarita sp.]